ncbi:MAG: glutamine amidotransferase [Thermoguttaceae bacterium]
MSLTFYPIGGSPLLVFLIVAAMTVLIVARPPRGGRLTPAAARNLALLRGLTLLVLAFCLVRPTLVSTQRERLASTVHILVDTSESMTIGDEIAGTTRFALATKTLADAASAVANLASKTELIAFTFDATPLPCPVQDGQLALPVVPKGTATAIGPVLDELRHTSSGKRLLGTLLLTDGNQKSRPPHDLLPSVAASRYRADETPIYTICFGQPTGSTSTQDVALEDVRTNETVFLTNEMVVTGSVRLSGFVGKPIEITLSLESPDGKLQTVDTTTVESHGEGQMLPFKLSTIPKEVGVWKYVVTAAEQPKELILTNNTQAGFVRVVEGGLTVLAIQGRRRFEQKWIRQALDASADIRVETWYLPVDEAFASSEQRRPLDRLASATSARSSEAAYFTPKKFSVYILDNVDAAAFHPEELEALAEAVRGGAGLLMLGGVHAFGAGGYAETPLAEVMPVVLNGLDRQQDDAKFRADVHWQGDISVEPTDIGLTHPVMRLSGLRDENVALWKSLPPLDGANKLGSVKMGALTLADGNGQPILVSQLFGDGRVVAFGGDSTWRWAMGGHADLQKRFWRQMILWLAHMDDIAAGECRILTDSLRIAPDEELPFRIVAKDGFGATVVAPKVTVACRHPDGTTTSLETSPVGDEVCGTVRGMHAAGDYVIEADVTLPDATIKKATGRFLVVAQNTELEYPVANPKLLERIATETGGQSVLPEELPALLHRLEQEADAYVELRQQKWSLYDTFPVLILFVLLVATEWIVRRWYGVM